MVINLVYLFMVFIASFNPDTRYSYEEMYSMAWHERVCVHVYVKQYNFPFPLKIYRII